MSQGRARLGVDPNMEEVWCSSRLCFLCWVSARCAWSLVITSDRTRRGPLDSRPTKPARVQVLVQVLAPVPVPEEPARELALELAELAPGPERVREPVLVAPARVRELGAGAGAGSGGAGA